MIDWKKIVSMGSIMPDVLWNGEFHIYYGHGEGFVFLYEDEWYEEQYSFGEADGVTVPYVGPPITHYFIIPEPPNENS